MLIIPTIKVLELPVSQLLGLHSDVIREYLPMAEAYELYGFSSKDGDICDQQTWEKMPKVDVIIHLAAKTFVPDSWEEDKSFIDINSLALLND